MSLIILDNFIKLNIKIIKTIEKTVKIKKIDFLAPMRWKLFYFMKNVIQKINK